MSIFDKLSEMNRAAQASAAAETKKHEDEVAERNAKATDKAKEAFSTLGAQGDELKRLGITIELNGTKLGLKHQHFVVWIDGNTEGFSLHPGQWSGEKRGVQATRIVDLEKTVASVEELEDALVEIFAGLQRKGLLEMKR